MEEEYGEGIPNVINAEAFIAARLKELTEFTKNLTQTEKVTTIFQRLPKHMRRRAMSHTVKRVPRNLRQSHKNQLLKNKALRKNRRKRKNYRTRPKKLSSEYNRRQKSGTWLETHIWHAKRFHMSLKWNYKIAESSYEKTFRATFRATSSHCLVQDISYHCCIELNAYVDTLVDTFKQITNSACGFSIKAKCWLNGNREGNITIFHANGYPNAVIGCVDFMWKPLSDESDVRTLWLWCHPSIHEELFQEFVEIFSLTRMDTSNTYINSAKSVTMVLLKNKLNRFRLTGPLSNAVLTKALHAADEYDKILSNCTSDTWWPDFRYQTGGSLELLKKYPLPFLLPAHSILGCNIVDPRLFLKQKRSKAVPENEGCDYCPSVSVDLTRNAIWRSEIRDQVSARKLPSAKLNSLRSELLIPGFDEQLLKTVNNIIPILLIQRPGSSISAIKSNYSCGWDIILPSNWGMSVWLSLILCGARAGGLRETRHINFESQRAPEMCPDSMAGKQFYAELRARDEYVHFKKPPKQRTNYLKFGVSTPFHCDWELLAKEWSSISNGSYFVLRDRLLLQQIQEYVEHFKFRQSFNLSGSLPSNTLIPVTVTMLGKGPLPPYSHICIPSSEDLCERKRDKCFTGPNEEPHLDVNKKERVRLKLEHAKELKRLRRKRIKDKRMRAGPPSKITKRKTSPTEAEVQAYLDRMRALWIPKKATELRKACARQICGFVVTSGFSFLKSCIVGHGYIIAEALTTLFVEMKNSDSDLVVLTRSPCSLNYRFCRINIIFP